MRDMACVSVLVLLASAGPGRVLAETAGSARSEGGWRLDQVAGRRALARGELGLAEELLSTALAGAGVRRGRAAVLEDLFAVGVLLADEGQAEPAIRALRRSLEGRRELYGAEAPELEPHLTLLGTMELRTRGRRAREDRLQAAEHLDSARRILERSVGTEHEATRRVAELTVDALRQAGRRDEAKALARARAVATPQGTPMAAAPNRPERPGAQPPRVPRLPSVRVQESTDPLQAQLERYRRLLQAHEGWVRQAATRAAPPEVREGQALDGLAELEELSYQADRLRLDAALSHRHDVTAAVDGLEKRIEGLLPDYGALAGGLGGAF